MGKLPAKLNARLELIRNGQVPFYVEVIQRIKDQDPYLSDYISDKGESYYQGMLACTYSFIETCLMDYNCYRGFQDTDQGRIYF